MNELIIDHNTNIEDGIQVQLFEVKVERIGWPLEYFWTVKIWDTEAEAYAGTRVFSEHDKAIDHFEMVSKLNWCELVEDHLGASSTNSEEAEWEEWKEDERLAELEMSLAAENMESEQ